MEDAAGVDLTGRVAVVTGAGAGLGRAEALALAGAGADVVLNDVSEAASAVAEEAAALGVRSAAVVGDVGDRATVDALMRSARTDFGRLDIVVNNAGILRDRMIFGMTDQEWDDVIRVHLRGHFMLTRSACDYWRQRSKDAGGPVYGRIVNTTSEAALFGAAGQPNYAAAKSGITALTIAAARGTHRYGVRANAICPRARTGMTEHVFGERDEDGAVDPLSTEHVAPFVSYLASPAAESINGQLFVVHGGMVALMAPPSVEQRFDTAHGQWTPEELAGTVGKYFENSDPERVFASAELASMP